MPRVVVPVLAAGRDDADVPPPAAPTDDSGVLTEHLARVPWRPGEVRTLDLGETPQHGYGVRLPAGHDGAHPLGVLLDLGGFAPPEGRRRAGPSSHGTTCCSTSPTWAACRSARRPEPRRRPSSSPFSPTWSGG